MWWALNWLPWCCTRLVIYCICIEYLCYGSLCSHWEYHWRLTLQCDDSSFVRLDGSFSVAIPLWWDYRWLWRSQAHRFGRRSQPSTSNLWKTTARRRAHSDACIWNQSPRAPRAPAASPDQYKEKEWVQWTFRFFAFAPQFQALEQAGEFVWRWRACELVSGWHWDSVKGAFPKSRKEALE